MATTWFGQNRAVLEFDLQDTFTPGNAAETNLIHKKQRRNTSATAEPKANTMRYRTQKLFKYLRSSPSSRGLRMVPAAPARAGRRTMRGAQPQAPGALPVLRTADELPESMAVLSVGASDLEEVAEPPDAGQDPAMVRVRKTPGATPVGATPGYQILDQIGESCLRNPLREIRTVGSVGGAPGNRRTYLAPTLSLDYSRAEVAADARRSAMWIVS
jgi:hypothetical protein